MKKITNALKLLTEQHDEVDKVISQIEKSDKPSHKTALFEQLADKLAAHSEIEEKLFYPSVMADPTCRMLIEATEEHLAVKRLLADMLALDAKDAHWDAKLKVLKESVHHHAREEEEAKLFPLVRKLMTADQLAGLGNEMLALFEDLMERSPRLKVPQQTREAAHLEAVPL